MTGLPTSIAFDHPDAWSGLSETEASRSYLSSDFCHMVYDDGTADRYIRCLLKLPAPEIDDAFLIGVWMSVSEASWEIYGAGFKSGVHDEKVCFGYLGNAIATFPGSLNLPADVFFQPGGARPLVRPQAGDDPLVVAQREGISVAEIEALLAALKLH